jgi:hypothetical protein
LRLGNSLTKLETSMKLETANLKLYIQVPEHGTLDIKHDIHIYLKAMSRFNASVACYLMMFSYNCGSDVKKA